MTKKQILPHKCIKCGCKLWFQYVSKTIVTAKRESNYLYHKGNYYCKSCFRKPKKMTRLDV